MFKDIYVAYGAYYIYLSINHEKELPFPSLSLDTEFDGLH